MSAAKKPGEVIRIDELTARYIKEKRRRGETKTAVIRRLLGLPSRKGIIERPPVYVLPSDVFLTIEDARGAAIVRAVRAKQAAEEPKIVREVI